MKNTSGSVVDSTIICFDRAAGGLATVGSVLAALSVAYSAIHILLDMALRVFGGTSTYVMDEFVGYAVACSVFLAMGKALREGALIRMSALLEQTVGRTRLLLEMLSSLAAIGTIFFVLHYQWLAVERALLLGTTSYTAAKVPLWIPKALIMAGLFILLVVLVAHFFSLCRPALRSVALSRTTSQKTGE
ncbi:TRAP transporter small permease subunit [Fodinicurvata sediminis]|uniref:TRAP transporter small permease subunit n=1 Tax=Fodinicurvata sediminis TaxID=1121832 RepID=UPI0003B4972C|nr:TRAP transporter small permease [Fodinicurvata sediminis]